MKRINIILPFLLSFLLLFSSYGNVGEKENINQIDNEPVKTSMEKERHFYMEFNSSWSVVKFSCNTQITIEELCVDVFSNLTHAKGESDFYILIDKNFTIFDAGGSGVYFYSYHDLFVHLNFFFINYTYDHFSRGNFSTEGKGWGYNITLAPNIYYLICLGTKSKNTNIKVWINTTGNVSFLATAHGNTTHFLDETDFLGKTNLCWYNGSIIIRGEKSFRINNTFIGNLYIDGGIGIASLQLINPIGERKKSFIVDLGFKKYKYGWGGRRYKFGDDIGGYIISNVKGKWAIKINMLETTAIRKEVTPNIYFLYGDIILP